MNVTGIILAGGKSSRMGQDKGLLLLNNKPVVQYVIDTLKPITNQIIIIANHKGYKQFGYPVFKDIVKEKGPVGGIYTALSYSKTNTNIILSCDTPFISTELINLLLKSHQHHLVSIPEYNSKLHPLIGIYSTSILPKFKQSLIDDKLKLMLVNQALNCNVVEIDSKHFKKKNFYNINTPTDLKQVENEN